MYFKRMANPIPYMKTLAPETSISGKDKYCIPQNIVGCSYLSLPEIPASCTKVLIFHILVQSNDLGSWRFEDDLKINGLV